MIIAARSSSQRATITASRSRSNVQRYGAVIDRPGLHPHTFRHSFAINSVKNGVDIRRLQLVLGHASMSTTAFYLNFNDRDIQDAYANVP